MLEPAAHADGDGGGDLAESSRRLETPVGSRSSGGSGSAVLRLGQLAMRRPKWARTQGSSSARDPVMPLAD